MKKVLGILTIVLLLVSVTFAGNYEIKVKKESNKQGISPEIWNKLVGPLKGAVQQYRKAPKIEALSRAKMKRITVEIPTLVRDNVVLDLGKEERLLKNGLQSSIINPVIQRRWKNPSFDVLNCLVKIRGDFRVLKDFQTKVRSISKLGDYKIVNVEIASQEIEKIAALSTVDKISVIMKEEYQNDRGTFNSGASKIRRKRGNTYQKGYTGEGVIVGIIDSGLDWSHPDFIDPISGESRVLYYWDTSFDTVGQTPADIFGGNLAGLDYGTLWTKADIDAGLCTSTDTHSHGTHVTGSAAGNGGASGTYTGMAPMADIIMVEGLDDNGNLFIFEMAEMHNKPCAVNMSYGPGDPLNYVSYWPDRYPADGSSLDAQWFDGLIDAYGAGRICNKSAGNDGEWNSYENYEDYPYAVGGHHSGASLATASTHKLVLPDYDAYWNERWGYSPYEYDYLFINVGMWYESPVQVSFISPNGNVIGPMVHGTAGTAADYTNGDGVINYDLTYGVQDNGAYPAYFDFGDYFGIRYYPLPGEWQILVEPIGEGTGYVDMWAGELNVFLNAFYFWMEPILCDFDNPDRTVVHSNYSLDESNAPWMLSTAAFVSRVSWPSIDGGNYSYTSDHILNGMADFSSPGPSRDRRVKPDIAAPGQTIVSSLTKDVTYPDPYVAPDGQHMIMSGTSQAAPHVTGA
ncbi:MAG: S8 family serine peptidase, partial [bacterium]|nr:S8 family serine peptidase [bacterium]